MKKTTRYHYCKKGTESGFTLIELLVSMAIFLLISGVAFRLFNVQQSSSALLNEQVGLNIQLRNAVAQMQLDVSNAGGGFYQTVNVPSWPIGVTISNNFVSAGTSCYDSTNKTYGYKCFDQLNIITAADPATYPAVNVTDSTGSASLSACSDTSTGTAYTQAANPTGMAPWTLAKTAAEFKKYDQVLFLDSTGKFMTTAVLTADGAVDSLGNSVVLKFNATNTDGSNSLANDPLDITACDNTTPCTATGKLQKQFCGNDYIIKLAPIQYFVCAGPGSSASCTDNSSTSPDIQDPKLMRMQNGTAAMVMDQVVGMRVGAAIYNPDPAVTSSTAPYQYNSACYSTTPDPTLADPCTNTNQLPYNFTVVRSVRISLIARTTPNYSASYTFRNAFDGGPYQAQGIAVVVNPRNMSMND
jgi:prepilin-type N-terminal cleavage/methylation domain-containing protein